MNTAQPSVGSSSTIWATRTWDACSWASPTDLFLASKEWVIPAKPKPGRKPKKDALPSTSDDVEVSDSRQFRIPASQRQSIFMQMDSKGRRVQNRYDPLMTLSSEIDFDLTHHPGLLSVPSESGNSPN